MMKQLLHRSKRPVVIISALVVFAAVSYNGCSNAVKFQNNLASSQSAPTGALVINQGATWTTTTAVSLGISSPNANQMYITNDSTCTTGGTWQPYATSSTWTIGQTNEQAAVYAKFMSTTQTESACIQATIMDDDIPPIIFVDLAAPAITNNPNAYIGFHASDKLSGVNQLLCVLPGQSAAVPCDGVYSQSGLADGNYLVQLLASDKAGNISAPTMQKFMIDTTPPTVVLNSTPASLTASTTAIFGFVGSDNLSGIAGYFCSVDKAMPYLPCVSGQSFTGLSQGPHNFAVHAVDNAGNTSLDATYNWTIDSSVPTVQFTTTPKSITNSLVATFGFTGQDDKGNALTVFQCRLNNAAFASCASPDLPTGIVAGTNTFGIRGQDVEGVYSAELDYTWLVDVTPPVVTILTGPSPLTNMTTANFTFSATDTGGSGVATVSCSLDGGAPTNCATMSESYLGVAPNMQHSFQVAATDFAGNTGMSAPYIWIVDTTLPVLTIVSKPASLSASPNATFQILATDQYGPITYMCGIDSGGVLTPCGTTINYTALTNGPHTFYAQAQDAAGNLSVVQTYSWTIETVGPQIVFTQTPGSTLVDTVQGILTYTITDPISTVASATCTLDTTSLMPCSISGETITFPILPDGTHTFTLSATNAAGVSSSLSYTFNVVATKIITFPTIGSVAAVAYEDLYGTGNPDYDYNDFLTEFQVTEKINSSNQVTDIYLDFYPRAVGAGYDHEFLLALSGTITTTAVNTSPTTKPLFVGAANIDISYYDGTGKLLSQQASAPYNNQDVVVFSSTHGAFGLSAGAGVINTALPTNYVWGSGNPSNYTAATQNARIHLALTTPASNPVPNNGLFDVSTLRMVLHVKNTNENVDIINVVPTNFTSAGYPWGFIIPTNWQWMQEGVIINSGYPTFASYREYLEGQNASCPQTDNCINWFNYPATGTAGQKALYPPIPFKAILPAP
jgi:Domain of unknown function (DUF4842)/Bacterial Ig-like domain